MKDAIVIAISAFGLTGAVSFMVSYHIRSGGSWRRNEVGVWLMLSRLDIALIFLLLIIGRVFGNSTWREILVYILVTLFAAQMYWPSRFIWAPHIHGIKKDQDREESPAHDSGT